MLRRWFGGKQQAKEAAPGTFSVLESEMNGRPLVGMIDMSYRNFRAKSHFPWFLSISLPLMQPTPSGLPTREDAEDLNRFEERIEQTLRPACEFHFVGRVTWNGHRELLYYVNKPKEATEALQALITSPEVRPFASRCTNDPDWDKALAYMD